MKLYEISSEYEKALSELGEMDLPEEVVKDTLEGLQGMAEQKGRAVGAFILNMQADIDTLKAHEAKIADKRKSLENRLNSLKEYLRFNMERAGIKKIEAEDKSFSATMIKPRETVVVDDVEKLPVGCFRVKKEADKKAIKAEFDRGGSVDGARIEYGKPGLRLS